MRLAARVDHESARTSTTAASDRSKRSVTTLRKAGALELRPKPAMFRTGGRLPGPSPSSAISMHSGL